MNAARGMSAVRARVGGMTSERSARSAISGSELTRGSSPAFVSTKTTYRAYGAYRAYATASTTSTSSSPTQPSGSEKPNGAGRAGSSTSSSTSPSSSSTLQTALVGTVLFGVGYYLSSLRRGGGGGGATAAAADAGLDTSLRPSDEAIKAQEAHQPSYGSKEDYEAAIKELQALYKSLGKSESVSTDGADREAHGVSEWVHFDTYRPNVVVWADTTEEVQKVVLIAKKYRVPIIPITGGTSVEGHFSSVSVSRFQRCIEGW